METRSVFRVCVVGGGIAGLSSCVEIFRLCDREGIEVEIILLEGRNRLGGRIHTSTLLTTTSDKVNVKVELGASWIHGIENNPIISLACDAGASFVDENEDVKMLHSNQIPVDPVVDERAGDLFDQLLDSAVSSMSIKCEQTHLTGYRQLQHGNVQKPNLLRVGLFDGMQKISALQISDSPKPPRHLITDNRMIRLSTRR